jgi:fructose-1,6-bisphosphatase/inositol monophosphatase family enzyme
VIASVVDDRGAVIACVVGDIDKNRIFFASKGCGTWVFISTGDLERNITTARRCRVSKVEKGRKTISIDLTTGYKKNGYRHMSDAVYGLLFARLFGLYKVQIGPNGINHVLVALGRRGVVGSITTALGGPWDVAPVLLILEAGGFAMGYWNGKPVDPVLVMKYNMLVTAASESELENLSRHLLESCYGAK